MEDVLPFLCAALLGLMALPRALRGEPPELARLLALSFGAHLFSSMAQIWITRGLYGGGDMLDYFALGSSLARLLHMHFSRFAPEVLSLLFQGRPMLPMHVIGGPTGTMMAFAGFSLYAMGGSLYGVCAVIATFSFYGKLALYRALVADVGHDARRPLLLAIMLVPTVVFWSCGLLKESLVIGPLGYLYAGLRAAVVERRYPELAKVALASLVLGLVKPYILFAVVAGAGAMLYGQRARDEGRAVATVRPAYLVLAAIATLAGVILLGRLFPEFALDNLASEMAAHQAIGQRVRGGSGYSIGDPTQRSLAGQLAFAPLAIVTSLFRPFLFEARNAVSLLNALESTAVTLLAWRAVSKRSPRALWRSVLGSPAIMFCLTFTLTMALAVGLATTNLGTLSRYRMPLLPFFVAVMMLWNADLFPTVRRRPTPPPGAGPRRGPRMNAASAGRRVVRSPRAAPPRSRPT
jgi:hypothetical protein